MPTRPIPAPGTADLDTPLRNLLRALNGQPREPDYNPPAPDLDKEVVRERSIINQRRIDNV